MLTRICALTISLVCLFASSLNIPSAFAEDNEIQTLPVDGTSLSFSVTNSDTNDTSCISVYQFTVNETSRIEFTVSCSNAINFGIQKNPVGQDFRWTDSDSLDYHSNQISAGQTVTKDYVMYAGTYYFWTEIIDHNYWTEPATGSIAADASPLNDTIDKNDNITREEAAEIEVGTHYYDVLTADLSHEDIIASELYDCWYKFTIEESGHYFMLGNLISISCEYPDASNNVFFYKEDETSYITNGGWHTRENESENNRGCYHNLPLEAGTYYFCVSSGTLNKGGLGFDFGIYPFNRGDIIPDGKINLEDASAALRYYAYKAAGLEASLTGSDDDYVQLMALLQGDVTRYVSNSLMSQTIEYNETVIDLEDATAILSYYAQSAAGMEPSWD
ncbi:MAG: hypothetical protein J6B17_01555 [Ruminococcus sp.]|nr:hypothetical protein [Ruminococcus sp.]